MSRKGCVRETAVLRAAHAGELPETLAAHAAGCLSCREAIETLRWMQSLARDAAERGALPDAKVIWWKAQLSERQAKVEKIHNLATWLACGPGAVIGLALVASHWYSIQTQAMKLLFALAPQLTLIPYRLVALTPLLLFFAVMCLVYPLLAND
jgi:hypothetical protein